MTDPRPDPVTEARDALATALASVHREADPEGRDFALADLILAALPDGWTLVREAGGVSVEALAKAMRQAMYLEPGFRDHPQPDEAYPDLARGVITILAARSAGSGSRVEAKWPVVGVGDKGHRYTTCGHCVEPDCSTHTGHIERCYTRPTPPPAVDGTRDDEREKR